MSAIETLTEEERNTLLCGLSALGLRGKALRIIDQLTAECARLREVLGEVNAHALAKMQETAAANAECARLEGDCRQAQMARAAMHAKLTAANELLKYISTEAPDTAIGEATMRRIGDHLEGQ